jgi:hypothetical protein
VVGSRENTQPPESFHDCRALNTHIVTSTPATIAIVTDDPSRPNHLNQFGNLSAAEGWAASTHSHPRNTNATVKSERAPSGKVRR